MAIESCPQCNGVVSSFEPQCPSCGHTRGIVAKVAKPSISTSEAKPCPYCAEIIRAEAIRCRHCQADLTATYNLVDANPGRNAAALLFLILCAIGCLLPWISVGAFKNRGMDNPDGVIVLVASLCGVAIALYNLISRRSKLTPAYLLIAGLCAITTYLDFKDIQLRAETIAESMNKLDSIIGNKSGKHDPFEFVGVGLYLVGFSSVGLFIASLTFLKRNQ